MKKLLLICLTWAALGLARARADTRIALVTDPHVTRGRQGDQPLYAGRFDAVIAQVNAAHVDVVLVSGDLAQNGRPEEWADFREKAKKFQAPVLWAPGNHDVGAKRVPGQAGGVTAARVTAYENAMGPSFFARTVAGVRVVALDSSLFGSGLPQEGKMWSLLETELREPSAIPRVVFMHYPPFVKSPDEKGGGYWNVEPEPRHRFLDLLTSNGVGVLLTGHLHYELINHYRNLLIVTSAPVSFGLPRGVAPEGWTLVTLSPGKSPVAEFKRI